MKKIKDVILTRRSKLEICSNCNKEVDNPIIEKYCSWGNTTTYYFHKKCHEEVYNGRT